MYLKAVFVTLFILSPLLSVTPAQADEYLIITNVPSDPGDKGIRKLIESHGEIKSIKCYDVQFSDRIRRSCNVLMWSKENARKVVESLNGNQLDGKKLYSKEIYPVPCPDTLA